MDSSEVLFYRSVLKFRHHYTAPIFGIVGGKWIYVMSIDQAILERRIMCHLNKEQS